MTSLDIVKSSEMTDLHDDFGFLPSQSFCNIIEQIQFEQGIKRYKELYSELCEIETSQTRSTCEFHSYYNLIITINFIDNIIVNDLKEYNKKLEKFLMDYKNNSKILQSHHVVSTCKRLFRKILPL